MAAADDPAEIQGALYSSPARGIFASDLTSYLETHGYRAFAFRAGWDDLRQHLLKGRPLIVAVGESPGSAALHYVVVAGLDSGRDLVLLNDPARRKLTKLDRKTFERQWSAMNQWTLLAVPR
jgi:ABC-type bacteriocin/lantibiotic exporter with double-glycine peptidase domain